VLVALVLGGCGGKVEGAQGEADDPHGGQTKNAPEPPSVCSQGCMTAPAHLYVTVWDDRSGRQIESARLSWVDPAAAGASGFLCFRGSSVTNVEGAAVRCERLRADYSIGGRHSLRVQAPGYSDKEITLTLPGDGADAEEAVRMTPIPSR